MMQYLYKQKLFCLLLWRRTRSQDVNKYFILLFNLIQSFYSHIADQNIENWFPSSKQNLQMISF